MSAVAKVAEIGSGVEYPGEAPRGEQFSDRLYRLRAARGMSQRDVAVQCERVSYAYISRLEAGARRASVRAIRELARALGVTPDYLEFGRELNPTVKSLERQVRKLMRELDYERKGRVRAEAKLDALREAVRGTR
jgi:transcriptional regulator with XRE-family HTH domain